MVCAGCKCCQKERHKAITSPAALTSTSFDPESVILAIKPTSSPQTECWGSSFNSFSDFPTMWDLYEHAMSN